MRYEHLRPIFITHECFKYSIITHLIKIAFLQELHIRILVAFSINSENMPDSINKTYCDALTTAHQQAHWFIT